MSSWVMRIKGLMACLHSILLWLTCRSKLQLRDRAAASALRWMLEIGPDRGRDTGWSLPHAQNQLVQHTDGQFTLVQNGGDQNHQVGSTSGAEDAGKHKEDGTPEEWSQSSSHGTHTWNTHVWLNAVVVCLRGDERNVSLPTNKPPTTSFRSKVRGRLWAIPRNKTKDNTTKTNR